jgi:hypothetical protein
MIEQKLPDPESSMGVLDFIASMTGSLSWPLAAFAIALLFRTQIQSLISRINEIGFGDAKARFAKELDAAEKKAEALPVPPEQAPELEPTATADSTEDDSPEKKVQQDVEDERTLAYRRAIREKYSQFGVESGRFAALLDIAPSAAILDTYRIVERTLHRVAERNDFSNTLNRQTVRHLAYVLAKNNIIPTDVAQLVAQLQEMRNRAAHGVEPTVTDAIRFRDIATRVVAALRTATR